VIICRPKEVIGDWVGQQIGNPEPWHLYEAFGLVKDGSLVGGVVIDNYIHEARCSIHCAGIGRKWLTKEFLFVVFDYVFRQLKCNAVLNIVDSNNTDSVRFTAHIGFKEVYRVKGGSRNRQDAVIFELQKDDCKWIRNKP